jgi:hypothetical protein
MRISGFWGNFLKKVSPNPFKNFSFLGNFLKKVSQTLQKLLYDGNLEMIVTKRFKIHHCLSNFLKSFPKPFKNFTKKADEIVSRRLFI